MRSGLFASVLLYLVAFGVSLLLKVAIDQVDLVSKYAPWAYTASLPIFGVFQIVAKSQITLWFEEFIRIIAQYKVFNFRSFKAYFKHLIILIETLLMLPVHSGVLMINSAMVGAYFIGFGGACFAFFTLIWMGILNILKLQNNVPVVLFFYFLILVYSCYFGFIHARQKYDEIRYYSQNTILKNYGRGF
jgi:hypothetical protein